MNEHPTAYTAIEVGCEVPDGQQEALLNGDQLWLNSQRVFTPNGYTADQRGRVTTSGGESAYTMPNGVEDVRSGTIEIVAPNFIARALAKVRGRTPKAHVFLTLI